MPLFRRQRSNDPRPAAPGPATDPAAGDADARQLLDDALAGRWPEVQSRLEAAGPMDREFFIDVVSDLPGRPGWLDEWVQSRPDSPVALLVRGAHGVRWAWAARGGGRASTVAEDAWEVFFDRLQAAERDLLAAARRDPADPTPWTNLLISGRGLQISLEETTQRFEKAIERERWLPYAHDQMLQKVCAKWSGSSEMMFLFARDTSAEAPEGASVHKIVPLAHLEEWLERSGPPEYFRDRSVQAELVEAADRSVFSGRFGTEKQSMYALQTFAMAFHLAGDRDRAAQLFSRIGDVAVEFPWYYLGDPAAAFSRARAAAEG